MCELVEAVDAEQPIAVAVLSYGCRTVGTSCPWDFLVLGFLGLDRPGLHPEDGVVLALLFVHLSKSGTSWSSGPIGEMALWLSPAGRSLLAPSRILAAAVGPVLMSPSLRTQCERCSGLMWRMLPLPDEGPAGRSG